MKNTLYTQKLAENIVNIFGKKGRYWLEQLPITIEKLAEHWNLTIVKSVENMTFNYVGKTTFNGKAAILKISCDELSYHEEKKALNYFKEGACIKIIDSDDRYHALLLQQAVPGTSLKSFYPQEIEMVMLAYLHTMQKLHSNILPAKDQFRSLNDWLVAIDQVPPDKIPKDVLNKAIIIKDELLSSQKKQIVLHGDLHHDNILKSDFDWVCIDPKGIIGEVEFEIAAFDFIHDHEINKNMDVKNIFHNRLALISEKSKLSAHRIKDWVFVRLILSAAWAIHDNCDPSKAIKLAYRLFGQKF